MVTLPNSCRVRPCMCVYVCVLRGRPACCWGNAPKLYTYTRTPARTRRTHREVRSWSQFSWTYTWLKRTSLVFFFFFVSHTILPLLLEDARARARLRTRIWLGISYGPSVREVDVGVEIVSMHRTVCKYARTRAHICLCAYIRARDISRRILA